MQIILSCPLILEQRALRLSDAYRIPNFQPKYCLDDWLAYKKATKLFRGTLKKVLSGSASFTKIRGMLCPVNVLGWNSGPAATFAGTFHLGLLKTLKFGLRPRLFWVFLPKWWNFAHSIRSSKTFFLFVWKKKTGVTRFEVRLCQARTLFTISCPRLKVEKLSSRSACQSREGFFSSERVVSSFIENARFPNLLRRSLIELLNKHCPFLGASRHGRENSGRQNVKTDRGSFSKHFSAEKKLTESRAIGSPATVQGHFQPEFEFQNFYEAGKSHTLMPMLGAPI